MKSDWETIGPLLHGTARAWRLKLDDRLKPMGLSQAKWRTLLHLSIASDALTQAEIAARLGVEEPSVVTLLHRLEREGWVTRQSSPRDRRCKIVHLSQRASQTNQFPGGRICSSSCWLRLFCIGFFNKGPVRPKRPSRQCDRYLSPKLLQRTCPFISMKLALVPRMRPSRSRPR